MKIITAPKPTERGMALIVALFLCLILSVTIAGYLKHARQQNYLSTRSQSWNLSVAVSEAGVEEGLQALNSLTNAGGLAAEGWSQNGSIYSSSRTLNSTTRYTVYINMASPSKPIITSQAFIDTPTLAMVNSVPPMFAAANVTLASPTNSTVSRAVRVTAGRSGLFLKALVAKHGIEMKGNGVKTDSFNSSSTNHSNNGMYPSGDHSKLLDNGDIASNDTKIGIVGVGNANIYGRVAVGPYGTIDLGPNGGVGTYAFQQANGGGGGRIQDGYFTDDMNFTFPTVALPYNVGLTPSSGTTTNYTYGSATNIVTTSIYPSPTPATGVQTNVIFTTTATLPSPVPYNTTTNFITDPNYRNRTYPAPGTYVGTVTKQGSWYYFALITGTNYTYPTFTYTYSTAVGTTNFTVTTSPYDKIIQGNAANMPPLDFYINGDLSGSLLVKGNARLVVKGNASIGDLTIASDGMLEMWVGGTSLSLSGNNTMNGGGYAAKLLIWCTDSVTSMSMTGNAGFTGCIIAPAADLHLGGGGNNDMDFIGCLVINSIKLNGHFSFHYDEALRNFRNNGRYMITEWNEIPISQVHQY